MAENLVKLMDSDGYRRLISIILSLKSAQEQEIEKCIKSYSLDMTIQKGEYIIYLPPNSDSYQLLMCEATHISNTTEPNMAYFKHIDSTQFEGYTEEELLAMLNLSETELQNLQNILNDDEISTHTTHSSSKIYAELLTVLSESKKFTIAEVAKIVSFSYKVVTSEDEVIDDKAIYLIENSTTGTYDMYLLVDGSPSKVGHTNINLDGYVKKEDIIDTFDETTIYADDDKVFSTKASKSMYDNLNQKKVDKNSIVETLSPTVTNNQIVGAKTVRELTIDKNVKTFTSVEQLGLSFPCTVAQVFSAMPNSSCAYIGVEGIASTIVDTPTSFGLLIIRKVNSARFNIMFNESRSTTLAPNNLWMGQLIGNIPTNIIWEPITSNGFNGKLNSTVNAPTDMNDFITPGNFEMVWDTSNIVNMPPISLGITRMSVKVESLIGDMYRQTICTQAGVTLNEIWTRNKIDGVWSTWMKLITTRVANVSNTNVNFISGTPFINVTASYVVKDGWCTIMFGGGSSLTVPSNVDNLVIAKNLPKPIKTMRYTSQLWGNASSSCLLTVTTDGNLATWLNNSCNGCFAYMSISYQVAEDWQP